MKLIGLILPWEHKCRVKKKTEEMVKIGKSTREREKKRGIFKSMMERQPATIRIAMPKF